jgi:tetratricopeptide (TPR) repeat protein
MGERRRKQEAAGGVRRTRPVAPPPPPSRRPPAARPRAIQTGGAFAWTGPNPRLEGWLGATWVLGAVLALGLAIRLAHFVALSASPFFDSLVLDARYYDAWARDIAGGKWIGDAAFWVDPLYAYLLGIVYAVAGHDLLWARLINIVCGLATAVLVAQIAHRVWQSRAAAALAAFGSVAFVPAYYFEGQTEKTAVTVVLIAAALALFLRGTRRALFAAGVVTGLAALARGNALLYAPFAAGALWLGWDSDSAPTAPRERRLRAVLFLAGMLPVVGLATLHNWLATRTFVPTTTNLGVNLYLGNHPANPYGRYTPPDFLHPETGDELPDFRAEAQRRTGETLSDAALSSYWTGQTLQAMAADPGLALRRTANKLFLTLNDGEIADNEDVVMVAEWSPVLRAPLVWMGELMPFALLGAIVGWRRRGVRIVAITAAIYLLSLLPFFVMARLRIQVVPLFCVLAGGALVWLIGAVLERRSRALVAAAAVLIPAAAFAYFQTDEMVKQRRSGLAIAWNNLGATFMQAQQTEDALRAYRRAVETDVNSVPASLRALADIQRQRGELAAAEATLRQLVELRPQSPSARESLRQIYALMLADPRWSNDAAVRGRAQRAGAAAATAAAPAAAPAPSSAASAIARARSLAQQGRTPDAIRVMQDAVRNGPYDENLHYMLGETMVKHATPAELVAFFSSEVGHDEKPQTSHYYWAVGLARGGDIPGAIAQLQQALEIDPAHEMSQRQWGLLLEQQGQPDAAIEHFREATRNHPGFKAAWEDAARLAAAQGRTAEADEFRAGAAAAVDDDRRWLYWARYLTAHERYQAAWVELQLFLTARPNDPEGVALREQIRPHLDAATLAALAAPPTAAPAPAAAGKRFDATARAALIARLRDQAGGSAWISYDGRDADAQRVANELAASFREAGWQAEAPGALGFPLRPGVFLFIADQPSPHTDAVSAALDAAGLTHTAASEYRQFGDEKRRADPNWRGISLAPGQEFALVIGRQ